MQRIPPTNVILREVEEAAVRIGRSFPWNQTKQGHEYWHGVYWALRNLISDERMKQQTRQCPTCGSISYKGEV